MIGTTRSNKERTGITCSRKSDSFDSFVMCLALIQSLENIPLLAAGLVRGPGHKQQLSVLQASCDKVRTVCTLMGREGHSCYRVGQGQRGSAGQAVIAEAGRGLAFGALVPDL